MIDGSTVKQCARCGHTDERVLEKDHITPRAEGGSDDPSNLQWLCRNCHGLKTRDDFTRFLSCGAQSYYFLTVASKCFSANRYPWTNRFC